MSYSHVRNLALGLVLAIGVSACGGSDSPSEPPGPAAVATVTVTPGTAALSPGATQQFAAATADASGNALTGRTITWSSSDQQVATVDTNGLATAVGEGTATITATSEGRAGTAEVTVELADFAPTEPTTLTGDVEYKTFTIPDGIAVTLAGETTIRSQGDVTIAGTMTGDCAAVRIEGATLNVTGTVNNACSGTGPKADLTLISAGDLTVSGATLGSSGDVRITNDTTLTDADFDFTLASSRFPSQRAQMGTCNVNGVVPVDGPIADDGTDSNEAAGDGDDGGNWRLDCNGDTNIDGDGAFGGSNINVPDAGDGGNATENDAQDPNKPEVRGGNGGNGGQVRVRATGNINFNGSQANPTRIRLAHGGNGGNATMIATAPGASATATAGNGGKSGTMNVRALGGINIANAGGLVIEVGRGGRGGSATATGADGADAGAAAAQAGGAGTATAGKGGDTPDAQLRARGNVTGANNISMTGGSAGVGGVATSTAGKGGNGNETFPNGAVGGNMTANGGAGGLAQARNLAGAFIAPGGMGGNASFAGGLGGTGWDGCSADPKKVGGNGGMGGSGSGASGVGGATGTAAGAPGNVTVAGGTGDGGAGGDGDGPGTGGAGGTDGIAPAAGGTRTNGGANFQTAADGNPCPNFAIDRTQLPTEFTHIVGTTGCPQPIGTITITNNSSSQSLTWSASSASQLTVSPSSGGLEPNQSVLLSVSFNCSQSTGFSGSVSVTVTQAGVTSTQTYTITGNVGEELQLVLQD